MTIRKYPVLLLALVWGCSGETPPAISTAGGTVVIAASSDPDILFPPAVENIEGQQAAELVYEYLADVGPAMNTIGDNGFIHQVASDWSWARDSLSIAFHLNPAARWQDSTPVTSRDVAFTFSVYRDSIASPSTASALPDIDSVTTPDSLTAVFWFNRRTPQQFYDAAAQNLILPAHVLASVPRDSLLAFAVSRTPVGSGKYRVGTWSRGSRFELDAVDGHYRGRAKLDRVIWSAVPEYQSAVTQLLAGATDVYAAVRPETVRELIASGKYNVVSLPGMDYVFLRFNLRDPSSQSKPHPLFASRELRRALTMSLDRAAMVRNLFDTLAAVPVGPTVRAYPTTDTALTQIPYETARAARILDSLGWKRTGADGMRARNGVPLRFKAIFPSSSMSRRRIAVLAQEQLRRVGIDMRLEEMTSAALGERQSKRDFDAVFAAFSMHSAPGMISRTWTTTAVKTGANFGGYSNATFDANVDSALSARTIATSRSYFSRAFQTIVDDAPAVWLYEPKTVIAIHKRLRTGPMRPNAWWIDLADWSIPESERIDRDKVSFGTK